MANEPTVRGAPRERPAAATAGSLIAAPRTALAVREALAERGLAIAAALALDVPPEARAILRAPRPLGWGHLLFVAVLRAELQNAADLHRRAFAATFEATGERVSAEEFGSWYRQRLGEAGDEPGLLARLTATVGEALPHALRADGVPADAVDLTAAARQLGAVYRDLLDWKRRARGAALPPAYRTVQSVLQEGLDSIIDAIPRFADDMATAVRAASERHAAGIPPEPMQVTLAASLAAGWTDRLAAAYATAQAGRARRGS